jgi:hypothetical protein
MHRHVPGLGGDSCNSQRVRGVPYPILGQPSQSIHGSAASMTTELLEPPVILESAKEVEQVCQLCAGTGEIITMEYVYPNEPHVAPIGTAPCPECQYPDDEDEDDEYNY